MNWNYSDARDGVPPVKKAKIDLNLQTLGVAGTTEARFYSPESQPVILPIEQGTVTVPEFGLWAVLELRRQ